MDERQTLGRSPLTVPRLGVGVMTWGQAAGLARLHPAKTMYGGPESAAEEADAFAASMAAGVTLFDTAEMYAGGASERRLGELADGTEALIATKFPPGIRAKAADLSRALDDSLGRLRRTSVDLYQHHFPSRRIDIPRLMQLMAYEVKTGRVRAVGVSNYSEQQMRTAYAALADHGVPLASNQVEYSLVHRQPETNGVLDACRELGVTLIAYQPLASGALTGKYVRARPRGLRRFLPAFRRGSREPLAAVIELLREIGARHDASPAQVALRWLVENEQVLPIPGAKNAGQAKANAGVLSFALDTAEVQALDNATMAWRG